MIFYESETKSDALRKAIVDPIWSETEKKTLNEILKFVDIEEENAATIASDEWQKKPTNLKPYPKNVFRGKWVNDQSTYTNAGQKYMIEDAGSGYRIGKCYPEPDDEQN